MVFDVLVGSIQRTSNTGIVFFLMMRRPPRSTQSRSSAASDVYKRQPDGGGSSVEYGDTILLNYGPPAAQIGEVGRALVAVSYTHLRAHETVLDLVCRLLLEKKNKTVLPLQSPLILDKPKPKEHTSTLNPQHAQHQ